MYERIYSNVAEFDIPKCTFQENIENLAHVDLVINFPIKVKR